MQKTPIANCVVILSSPLMTGVCIGPECQRAIPITALPIPATEMRKA